MNDVVLPKLELGDFVRHKIRGYTSLIYNEYLYQKSPWTGLGALIVETSSDWTSDFIKVGTTRAELPSELEKVLTTVALISKAKEYLINALNSGNIIDNLTYIEILAKLNEQEKGLK
jgi:hypothetical protein